MDYKEESMDQASRSQAISPSVLSAGCTFSGETPRKRTLGGALRRANHCQFYPPGVPFQGKHKENEHRVEHFGANHSCSIRQARGERGSHRHTIFWLQQCIDAETNNRKRGYNKHQSISISVYQHLSAFSISNQPFLFWSNGCIVSYYHK